MKYVNLLGPAHVNGVLRHPHEGAFKLTNEDADRLIKNALAVDVTDDFPDDDSPPAKVTVKPSDPKAA